MTDWREQRCLDSYRQRQISQSDCKISSNCGKNRINCTVQERLLGFRIIISNRTLQVLSTKNKSWQFACFSQTNVIDIYRMLEIAVLCEESFRKIPPSSDYLIYIDIEPFQFGTGRSTNFHYSVKLSSNYENINKTMGTAVTTNRMLRRTTQMLKKSTIFNSYLSVLLL